MKPQSNGSVGPSTTALLASLALLAGVALIFVLPSAAVADSKVKGEGRLVVISPGTRSLLLEDQVSVRVSETARIYDGDERRIHFRQIPVPESIPIRVFFEGTRSPSGIVASRVRVLVVPQ